MTFEQIYEGYKGILTKTKIFIPLLYEKGREEGKSIKEIRSRIEGLGVEYRTSMRYTPDWAKQKQLHGPRSKKVDSLSTQQVNRRLVVDEEPTIPPPHQPIVELEPELPKAIPTGDRKIKLDTGKFRSDLRIALINGDKVWLEYNDTNDVISIIEM